MAEIARPAAYRVDVIESERGWGQKIAEVKYFEAEAEARQFAEEFNAKNTSDSVPDWYMYAHYVGRV